MNAYADNNFLINCINQSGWRAVAANACKMVKIKLVLSPWSIYEVGTARPLHMEEMLTLIEDLSPSWILERVDLQLREFIIAWNDFWNGTRTPFLPIRTLVEVQASFLRRPAETIERYSLRDYAAVWQRPQASNEADIELRRQSIISSLNHDAYLGGELTARAIFEIRKRYIARQFANSRRLGMPLEEIHRYENWILGERKLEAFISFFVEFGGMDGMLAHRVEESLTFNQWQSNAILNPNRQLDRFHAIAALPYCNLFVTSDGELAKKTAAIRGGLKFKIADVVSGEEFIETLRKDA